MGKDNKKGIDRRSFLKVGASLAMVSGLGVARTTHARDTGSLATLIDLSLCDGCPERDTPACVSACRARAHKMVPDPVGPIPELFPRGRIEDFSDKKDIIDRFTPYNWLYVEEVQVKHQGNAMVVHIPRRCMHCDYPACANLCPFSANKKMPDGAVVIDPDLCFGGAKCRTVCPWHIPQRQSGIGLYLDVMPTLAGNGTMFKCDLCHDLVAEGKNPVCMDACPRQAMIIGPRDAIYAEARDRAEKMHGYIYGMDENGGTGTVYVSPVPFDVLDAAITKGPGRPGLGPVASRMKAADPLAKAVLGGPLLGIGAGVIGALAVKGSVKGDEKDKGGSDND
ncbi:MAG: 4Fe-4S dicluster domain-containing protein [Thermodesulfobacteriota bacterium]|nr:4Fe-4S dicluster domain-containing protein [Thermodesulfobacteriota bacterium]